MYTRGSYGWRKHFDSLSLIYIQLVSLASMTYDVGSNYYGLDPMDAKFFNVIIIGE